MTDQFGIQEALKALGVKDHNAGTSTGSEWLESGQDKLTSVSPADGAIIGTVSITTADEYEQVMQKAESAFKEWRKVPAPKRGEVVRQIGEALRKYKEPLGKLVSYEMGKSYQEGLGEVQEMIDICDFAVGLSRQLYGLTMHSERPNHRMYEQYHPLGVVGIISSFNFPVAVWSWNSMIAWVCGDVAIWKPSEKVPLCSIACQNIITDVFAKNDVPEGVSCVINGDRNIGELMTNDRRVPLISATGSIRMGKEVGAALGARLGRALLELGGNNAIIVTENADLDITLVGALFGAVGTCGQRCTSTRRLIIHESVYDEAKNKLQKAYTQLKIGNPLNEDNHVGPLIDHTAVELYEKAIIAAKEQGGNVVVEGGVLTGDDYESGCYVKPAIMKEKIIMK